MYISYIYKEYFIKNKKYIYILKTRQHLKAWVWTLIFFFISHIYFLGSSFLIHKNGDNMTCLISLQRGWLRITEVEAAVNLAFLVANQRSGPSYHVWLSKYQCRVSLVSAWYHPLTSMMGGRVDRGGTIRAHHAHHPLNADRQEARHTNDNHHLYTI